MGVHTSITLIDFLISVYKVPLERISNRNGGGILIAIGSGLMMATIDSIKTIEYYIDLKDLPKTDNSLWFFQESTAAVPFICIHGWLSISKPDFIEQIAVKIQNGVEKNLSKCQLIYKLNHNLDYGIKIETFDELIRYGTEQKFISGS